MAGWGFIKNIEADYLKPETKIKVKKETRIGQGSNILLEGKPK